MEVCPLCSSKLTQPFSQDKFRHFELCTDCHLIYVPRSELISPESEKDRYTAHQNDEQDPGYQQYLGNIAASINRYLKPNASGLDFGCGRTQILACKLSELGHVTDSFDVFFLRDESIWTKKYDFIILSEVIEHLRNPREEMERLSTLLNPQGLFFIKTRFAPATKEAFDQWFYKRDITHVQFFNHGSMSFLKEHLKMKDFELIDTDLCLLRLH